MTAKALITIGTTATLCICHTWTISSLNITSLRGRTLKISSPVALKKNVFDDNNINLFSDSWQFHTYQ